MKKFILQGAKGTVFWLSLVFMLFLTAVSLFSTAYFGQVPGPEHILYRMDFIPANLLFLILVLAVFYLLDRKNMLERIPIKGLAGGTVLFVAAASILWICVSHTYPEADQKAVSWMAYLMSQDYFLYFEPGKYMQIYPNQLGLSAVLEILYRITGGENWDAFRYLTALSNGAVVYFLYKITDRLFQNRRADCLVLFGSIGCIQIILYSTFLYGIMLGLAFSLAAFYVLLVFLDRKKMIHAVLAGILIGISILIKNNYSIFLVAMVILLLYKALEGKNLKPLLAALILVLATAVLSSSLTAFYEYRSGMELGSGMPKSLWIAMGMQEGERAEGWYNDFNLDTYTESGYDKEESSEAAEEAIADSLKNFAEDPAYALNFYYKKTVSQWNEPTFEALWINQFHMGQFSYIVQSIYDGKLGAVLEEYMNLFQSLIYGAVLFCLWRKRKKWNMEQLFLPLAVLGGFLFHTLWEAKSQYILPYFVCMLPCAAAGLAEALDILKNWRISKIRFRKNAEEQ